MTRKLTLLTLVLLLVTATARAQETFSIDITSGSPAFPGDILAPGLLVVFSDVTIAAGGVLAGAELDGLSDGMDVFDGHLMFSVDHLSGGLAGDVVLEAAGAGAGPMDQPADVFMTPLTGTNTQFRDGDGFGNPGIGVPPPLGLAEPYLVLGDNLDAYDRGAIGGMGPIYLTVGAAAPVGLPTDAIHTVATLGAPLGIFAPGPALALVPSDDIDAIFIDDLGVLGIFDAADTVGFSLSGGSPSLAMGSTLDIVFGVGAPMSAADVFVFTPGFAPLYIPASALGLAFTDNVDALEVPEPATMSLLAIGAVAVIRRKRS